MKWFATTNPVYQNHPETPTTWTKIWNELSGRTARDEQNAWNKEQSLEAYQRDLEMWNLQNEYNSPSSQMARYQAAGLNPLLVYGQGNPGNASGAPSYNPSSSASRPSGMENLSKVANLVGLIVGLKGNLASADAAAQNAKRIALQNKWFDKFASARYWSILSQNPMAYFKLEDPDTDFFGLSPKELYEGDPGMIFLPGMQKALSFQSMYPYQGKIQEQNLYRLQNVNSLLNYQKKYFGLDKWIGYGTDILGSLLQIGNFGLGAGKFNVFKKMHGF